MRVASFIVEFQVLLYITKVIQYLQDINRNYFLPGTERWGCGFKTTTREWHPLILRYGPNIHIGLRTGRNLLSRVWEMSRSLNLKYNWRQVIMNNILLGAAIH